MISENFFNNIYNDYLFDKWTLNILVDYLEFWFYKVKANIFPAKTKKKKICYSRKKLYLSKYDYVKVANDNDMIIVEKA